MESKNKQTKNNLTDAENKLMVAGWERGWGAGWEGDRTKKYKQAATKTPRGVKGSVRKVVSNTVTTVCGVRGVPDSGMKEHKCLSGRLFSWN